MDRYLRLIRPAEWIKNVFVFAALVFGDKLRDLEAVRLSIAAFLAFCFASSAGYIFNDLLDCERDRHHPIKKKRPLPSGAISQASAVAVMFGLLVAAGLVSLVLPERFGWSIGTYIVLSAVYSLVLKYRMLVDVIAIAVLFVLRAIGGALAIQVVVSPWLLVCTFMLCLFLGFGKRRCEISMLQEEGTIREHRPTLVHYTPDLLNHLLSTSGGIAIVTFLLYTLDPFTPSSSPYRQQLLYTLPLVIYGIYRYAMLIELGKSTGPTDLIVHDRPFLATILLWAICAVLILYGTRAGLLPGLVGSK